MGYLIAASLGTIFGDLLAALMFASRGPRP